MESKSLGFIGGGRITRILLQAFTNRNVNFREVIVTETNSEVLARLKSMFPFIRAENEAVASRQDIVFISLHPPVIMDTLEKVKDNFKEDATLISLAPKINIARLSSKLPGVKNIARLIPNATSYINQGYNPVTFAPGFDPAQKKVILDMLKELGSTFEVSEEKLESYAIISAMLPTYFWFQWKELADIGAKIGLTEDEAKESINQTIKASLDLLYKSGLSSKEVIDLIPVKPIGEHEPQIVDIYNTRLLGLFEKIKP